MLSLGVHAARWPILALWTAWHAGAGSCGRWREAPGFTDSPLRRGSQLTRALRQAWSSLRPWHITRTAAALFASRARGGLMLAQAALNNGRGRFLHTRGADTVGWLPGRRAARAGTVLVTSRRAGTPGRPLTTGPRRVWFRPGEAAGRKA